MRRDVPGRLAQLCLLPLVAIVVWLAGRPLATDDTWWHLALGRAFAQGGLWLDADPLFHTVRGQPTVPQEWLFQVALHGVREAAGFHALRALHALAALGTLAFVYAVFRRAASSRAAAACATACFACLAWFRLFQLRPDLLSIPASLALYLWLLAPERAPSWRRVAAALALLLVWVNAHPLFAIGLGLLVAALAGLALEGALRRWWLPPGEREFGAAAPRARRLATALALGCLVTLANPRGVHQHATFFVESASGDIWLLLDDFLRFDPLAPPAGNLALTPLAWALVNGLLAASGLLAARAGWRLARERSAAALRELDAVHLGLAAAGALAMVVAARFLWLGVFPLLYLLRAEARALGTRVAARAPASWAAAAATAALALAFPRAIRLDAFVHEVASEPAGYLASPWLDERYCGPGMRFLREARLRGNLFQPFNLGGFLGYWLAPELRTFIDGRLDHVPSEVLADYLQIRRANHRGAPEVMRERLAKWNVDVFVGLDFPGDRYLDASWVAQLRRLPAWIPIFATEHCGVYLRRVKGSEENLLRVRAYYAQRQLPFDGERGIDASELIRKRPAWARRQRLIPPDFEALEAAPDSPDPALRRAALERLGELFWRIGAFRDAIRVERERLRLEPGAPEARRRLADALLLDGRPAEALEAIEPLYRKDPDYADAHAIRQIAANLVASKGAGAPGSAESEPVNASGAGP